MDGQFAAFVAFTLILVITPGAATAVVVRNVLNGGKRGGLAAATGAAVANATHAAIAAFGLAAFFARVPPAFLALRYGGALYLAYLGIRGVASAWTARPVSDPGGLRDLLPSASRLMTRSALRQGLVTNLLNPAIPTYYLTAVPSFLPPPGFLQRRFAIYAAIHVLFAFFFHCVWVFGLDALRRLWAKPAARRGLETLSGLALVGLAARIAWG